MKPRRIAVALSPALAVVFAVGAAAQPPDPYAAADGAGYGYFRTVEGISRLTTFDKAEPIEVEPNYPVLVGDRIFVTPGARLEAVLPDRTVVRADGGTDLYFEQLALSADAEADSGTRLALLEGELQVVLRETPGGLEPPRVETVNAAIYLQGAGNYRIRSEEWGSTEIVVRAGFAEIVTGRGSSVVRAGESVRIDGRSDPSLTLAAAGAFDGLEHWGAELDGYAAAGPSAGYVDPSLAYSAAPLDRHGQWLPVEQRYAWRPYVASHWRPYTDGWWMHTPSGLSWVAAEPWGWLTSHYGSWVLHPIHGWIWYPGSVYSPAWVFWYWGPTHVAWVPAGYYHSFYRPHFASFGFSFGLSFRFGVFGWAGGSWDHFSPWTFCPVRYFGRRHYNAYWRSGHELRHYGGLRAVPRGLLLTDTRPLAPSYWGKPSEVANVLRSAVRRSGGPADLRDLDDVTDFVSRSKDLDPRVRSSVFGDKGESWTALGPAAPSGGRSAASRGYEAPWRVERPAASADERGRESYGSKLHESAVLRGARIESYRQPSGADSRFGGASKGGYGSSAGSDLPGRYAAPDRSSRGSSPPAAGAPRWVRPEGETGGYSGLGAGSQGSPRTEPPTRGYGGSVAAPPAPGPSSGPTWTTPGRSYSDRPLPPSGRSNVIQPVAPSPGYGSVGGRPPVVRRLLDGLRSRWSSPRSEAAPPRGSGSYRPEARSGSGSSPRSGSYGKPSSGSSKPSAKPRSSGSSRSGKSTGGSRSSGRRTSKRPPGR